jgi:hypothetical protein
VPVRDGQAAVGIHEGLTSGHGQEWKFNLAAYGKTYAKEMNAASVMVSIGTMKIDSYSVIANGH